MFKVNTKRMYFDSDDDFYKFCVDPYIIPIEYDYNGETKYYMDFNFTKSYQDALNKGKIFIIKDPNSQIFKHQAISYRTITKPIQNLEEYFGISDI